ncbi:condensin complex subunit 2-like isoform X2 [Asparagus officinalis]|uniref:condensin complex subunit 2-like isoform X2 n=1 Tax=Asparagus officinalis TaxID=4686 RepID=UPI00098E76CF|nr:condensin complex subunit 2-like isoform X2 [Asparagus officinalis]
MASRIQSPVFNPNPFPLGSNDDDLERAQARAARAASIRRRSVAFSPPPPTNRSRQQDHPFLASDQIMDLFQNCIKLASENKINQKNTWELGLIDHLSEIVRVRDDTEDNETNFQKASCTLEAGVKIYSLRVDSVHSEAYKVLGGINRAGREEDGENAGDGEHSQNDQTEGLAKKDLDRKLSPLTTLESSYEALNIKKFDVAFTVDPLYHQTSAQFDEGGAKGLLLNNLGVYGSCRVIFDSFESPEKDILTEPQNHDADVIDLTFAKEIIEQMISYLPTKSDISPTLRDIVSQFDEDNCRPSAVVTVEEPPLVQDDTDDYDHPEVEGNFDDCGAWSIDHNEHASFSDNESSNCFISTDANFTSHEDENSEYTIQGPNMNQKLEKIADFLCLGLGFTSKSNAWAGPDHWKYQKVKEQIPFTDNGSELASKKPKIKKGVADLDFTKSLDIAMLNIFAPPKNPKSLLLPVNRAPCNITLPEDCHYKPENLVKLLLLPDVMCLGKKARRCSDESRQDDGFIPFASYDDDNMGNDDFPTYNSDIEDPGTLVRPPRQVNKVDIQYDKVSKQVDVHALKDMLWSNIRESVQMSDVGNKAAVSLKQILRQFSSESCPAASLPKDISPHLFFICLLHLANEHCLSLHDHPTLDELDIRIPSSAFV